MFEFSKPAHAELNLFLERLATVRIGLGELAAFSHNSDRSVLSLRLLVLLVLRRHLDSSCELRTKRPDALGAPWGAGLRSGIKCDPAADWSASQHFRPLLLLRKCLGFWDSGLEKRPFVTVIHGETPGSTENARIPEGRT